jgi:cytoskeletal protein CcmA (bactofilin family)
VSDEKTEDKPQAATADSAAKPGALPLKPTAPQVVRPVTAPVRASVSRPEIVRRPRDYTSSARDERSMSGGYGGDGKKLIVGRDIALSGAISSCEKLVVEGRVEANMSECTEMEIAESGTFKGSAEIEVAEISGAFEGSITARDLLIVRSTGRVTGTVRYGRLEIERGGEIDGDVKVLSTDQSAASGVRKG